jgi:cytochrome c biogenesis protein
VTFDSVKRFAGLSVRTDPGAPISLVSAVLATAGLILGLTIKRRRVFVRVRAAGPGAAGVDSPSGDDGRPATVVSIGGLSKDSDAGLAAIVAAVHDRLAERNYSS